MRKVIVMLMIVAITGTAIAQDLGSSQKIPAKNTPIVQYVSPEGTRQGGENIATAVVIPSLPFSDDGTTAGRVDDYDEVCPYSGSLSPDVVYSYTPATDMSVMIDLCESGYDTKLYVYDFAMNLVDCSDDFYMSSGSCYVYSSKIENLGLVGGMTYYIVVDGYGTSSGLYHIEVSEFVPCVVACPADAVPEGEPALHNGYADEYNSGCNGVLSNNYQAIDWINDEDGVPPYYGCAQLCGNSGWFVSPDGATNQRDTDWFIATALTTGVMEFTVESQYPCYIFELVPSPMDCAYVAVGQQATADCRMPATLSIGVTAGDVVYLWVGPTTFTGPVTEFPYFMTVCNNEFGTVSNEDMNWGQVKTLYK